MDGVPVPILEAVIDGCGINIPAECQQMSKKERYVHAIIQHPQFTLIIQTVKQMFVDYQQDLCSQMKSSNSMKNEKKGAAAAKRTATIKKKPTTSKKPKAAPKRKRACADDK